MDRIISFENAASSIVGTCETKGDSLPAAQRDLVPLPKTRSYWHAFRLRWEDAEFVCLAVSSHVDSLLIARHSIMVYNNAVI